MIWIKFNKETDQIPKGCLWVFGINGVEHIEDGELNNKNYSISYQNECKEWVGFGNNEAIRAKLKREL